jgi:hypothetical protein
MAAITNPLRDEPNPIIIATTTRVGLVGLVACAIFASSARLLLRRPFNVHVARVGPPDLGAEAILKRRQ